MGVGGWRSLHQLCLHPCTAGATSSLWQGTLIPALMDPQTQAA